MLLKLKQTIKNLIYGSVSYSTPAALWVRNKDGVVMMYPLNREKHKQLPTMFVYYPTSAHSERVPRLGSTVHVIREGRGHGDGC